MSELPPDPFPVTTPHRLMVFGRTPSGTILVACPDCDGEILGEVADQDAAIDLTEAHARALGY